MFELLYSKIHGQCSSFRLTKLLDIRERLNLLWGISAPKSIWYGGVRRASQEIIWVESVDFPLHAYENYAVFESEFITRRICWNSLFAETLNWFVVHSECFQSAWIYVVRVVAEREKYYNFSVFDWRNMNERLKGFLLVELMSTQCDKSSVLRENSQLVVREIWIAIGQKLGNVLVTWAFQ